MQSRARAFSRGRLAVIGAIVATLSVAAVQPASAGTTSTTFEVTSGGLAITAFPASVNLGTAATTGSISGSLGDVTAQDARGSLLGQAWTASASSSDFVTGGATLDETVDNGAVTYQSVLGTSTGVVTCVGTVTPQAMSAPVAAMSATLATLTNSCTWNPTIAIPNSALSGKAVGTYTGTITHSVA